MSNKRKPHTAMEKLFKQEDYGADDIRDHNGILAQLFRRCLRVANFNRRNWPRYLNDYINSTSDSRVSFRTRTNDKSNLTKALCNPYMTIRSFIRAMAFLKVRRFRITLSATLENGEEIVVSSDIVEPTYGPDLFTEDEIFIDESGLEGSEIDNEPEFEDELPVIPRS